MIKYDKFMRRKSPLTITLSNDTLKKVDSYIDGKQIRSRSHAIEHLITKSLSPRVDTAILLAGGRRKEIYGPLATISGRSLIVKLINDLKSCGITNLIICAGNNKAKIKKEIEKEILSGVKITFVDEKGNPGGAGAVKNAKKYITSDPFLVIHTDILIGINYSDFIDFHEREKTIATIAVKPRIAEESYGKVILQGNKITEFMTNNDGGISIVNVGAYIFTSEIFKYIPTKTPASFEKDVFPHLSQEDQLTAFLFQGIWFDISNQKTLTEAQRRYDELKNRRR